MAEIEYTTVGSIQDFVKYFESIETKLFYRGQRQFQAYELLPALYRKINNVRLYENKAEEIFLNKYKSRAMPYLKSKPECNWEWTLLMQHYKTPTRLLDWSENPLVSLYFAISGCNESNFSTSEPIVWLLNPYLLNEKFTAIPKGTIPIIEKEDMITKAIDIHYAIDKDSDAYPIAISGPLNNSRIQAQRGVFTLFPNKDTPLDKYEDSHIFLKGIKIENNKILAIKKQLFYLGFNESTIFPELDSLSKDIQAEYFYEEVMKCLKSN